MNYKYVADTATSKHERGPTGSKKERERERMREKGGEKERERKRDC